MAKLAQDKKATSKKADKPGIIIYVSIDVEFGIPSLIRGKRPRFNITSDSQTFLVDYRWSVKIDNNVVDDITGSANLTPLIGSNDSKLVLGVSVSNNAAVGLKTVLITGTLKPGNTSGAPANLYYQCNQQLEVA